jgi:hypothetical protein
MKEKINKSKTKKQILKTGRNRIEKQTLVENRHQTFI